jgi:N utilization substance protein B
MGLKSKHGPQTTSPSNQSELIQALSETLNQEAGAHAPTQVAKKPSKSARSRAREFALQALYQLLIGKNDPQDIDVFTRDLVGFNKADSLHYDALLHGCAKKRQALNEIIEPVLDRPLKDISPIEHAVMWLGVYELEHCLDVPWRVVLNEYVELAKQFGGTDGHKYVNAVLNAVALSLRSVEIEATPPTPTPSSVSHN